MPNTGRPMLITSSSRVMLPAYVLAAAWIGIVYIADPGGRISRAPGLEFARLLLPMWAWGLMFVAIATAITATWAAGRENPLRAALLVAGVVMVAWALIYAVSIFINPNASPNAPVWPLLGAAACKASERSIRNRGA